MNERLDKKGAMQLFCICAKLAATEKLLSENGAFSCAV